SFLLPRGPPGKAVFPYTTLFRSEAPARDLRTLDQVVQGSGRYPEHPRGVLHAVVLPGRRRGGALAVLRRGGHRPSPSSWVGWCGDRKSTRLNSSHVKSSYAVFCL